MTARAAIRSSRPAADRRCTVKGCSSRPESTTRSRPSAGDAGHRGVVADPVAEDVGEGLEVALGPVAAGRVGGSVGAYPPGRGEQLVRGRVDELAPGREQPDMGPLAYGAARDRACLQDQGFQTTLDEVGGCGETDGACCR